MQKDKVRERLMKEIVRMLRNAAPEVLEFIYVFLLRSGR